ncbi:glycosyltransferase family 2 protein [Luteimonas aquatica]|uniref:glycosyltransferase family 2 protein n=1 Tax=Luteimonas aquatica TaxID=450364 RepID=UPI001F59088F|nr:glycosyltransferase family 2 protein [Luteimonas aquatica]
MLREDADSILGGIAPQGLIVAVIPCYRVRRQILDVIAGIPDFVDRILVVDDACPEGSGAEVEDKCPDPRVRVLRHASNAGVGAAMATGYREALACGASIAIKIDGDGQMDPAQLPHLLAPLLRGEADYTKGNRFFDLAVVERMPARRLFGNAVLSFMNKASSGYWAVFDPTNGYTAIHAAALRRLPLGKLSRRYFFETDMLFRLNTIGAVVEDVPMEARYGEESSNLRISRVVGPFLFGHLRNIGKRIFYNYFLRDFSVASVQLIAGVALLLFGTVFGGYHWWQSLRTGIANPVGTVILSALSLLAGLQLLLAFLSYDMAAPVRRPLQKR